MSAGHNPPILVKNGEAAYLKTKGGLVLAGMEDVVYREYSLALEKGDVLYLYTDGVTEANSAGKELVGEERLIECFADAKDLSAEEIVNSV